MEPGQPRRTDLDRLALDAKVARLFWVAVHGATGDEAHPGNRAAFGVDTPVEVIRRHRPGGVVLFEWAGNTAHPLQVAALTRELRAASAGPLGVAIDQEGGRVTRLRAPATVFPSARAVAAAGDRELAARRWRAGAAELAAVGVTTNLAPVVDLGNPTNPVLGDRTFAEDPSTVAREAAAAVRGLREGGVAAVAKHFPGHGATAVDSHHALPVVALSAADLEPHVDAFRRLLATAPPAGVMTAQVLVPALDAQRPATVSVAVLTGLLREELGFAGAVLTDSLAMAGIRTGGDDAAVAVAALAAGADVLLTPPDLRGAVEAVCAAVRDGRLDEGRVDDALRRAAPLSAGADGAASPTRVGAPEHRSIAAAIARRALTVEGPAGRVPLGEATLVVVGTAGSGARALADALRRRGRDAALVEAPAGDAPAVRAAAGRSGAALVLVRRAPELDGPAQDGGLRPLASARAGAVLVETGITPAAWSDGLDLTVLRTHGACATAMDAAADALAGPAPPGTGETPLLPVV